MTVKRSWKVIIGGAAPVLLLGLAAAFFWRPVATASTPTVTVYKSPT